MVKDTEIPELISLKEACEILKVHANTLRNWDRKGILKAVRIGEKKIRRYRKKKGWSQEQLAFEADLHRAYIGHIERGEKNIGLINFEKIAKALQVSSKELMP